MSKKTKLITKTDLQRLYSIIDGIIDDSIIVHELDELLADSKVIEPADTPTGLVTMNTIVRGFVQTSKQQEFRTFTLVYPKEINISDGRISIFTHLGIQLLGSEKGDHITWQGNDGTTRSMVLDEIIYQPETSGDWHL